MTKDRIEKKFDRYYGGADILFLSCIINFIAIGFFLALSGTDQENGYTALFMFLATAVMLIGICRLITANVAFAILYVSVLSVKPHTTEVACFLLPSQDGSPLGGSDCPSTIQPKLSVLRLTPQGPHSG